MKEKKQGGGLPSYMRPTAASQAKQQHLSVKKEDEKDEKKVPVRVNDSDNV